MASIDEYGILVPVSVYEEKGDDGTEYVIVDGERRWRCSLRLNLKEIPVIIIDKPDQIENLLTMFNIHMVREPWDDMPTAWALERIMRETGITDTAQLSELTGLTRDSVEKLQIALKQPQEYQELINKGDLPINLFVELETRVIRPLQKSREQVFLELGGAEAIVKAFVEKRLAGNLTDVVDIRKISQIIRVATQEEDETKGTDKIDFDAEIRLLVQDRNRTIEETYENTVETVVETETFVRQCERLVKKLRLLLSKDLGPEDSQRIKDTVSALIDDLESLFDEQ